MVGNGYHHLCLTIFPAI